MKQPLKWIHHAHERVGSIAELYAAYVTSIRSNISNAARLRGSALAEVWASIAGIAYGNAQLMQMVLPRGITARNIRHLVTTTQPQEEGQFLFLPKHPSWLKLPKNDFDYLLHCWYHGIEPWDEEYIDLWLH